MHFLPFRIFNGVRQRVRFIQVRTLCMWEKIFSKVIDWFWIYFNSKYHQNSFTTSSILEKIGILSYIVN